MKAVVDADQLIYAAGFATKGEPVSHACQLVKKQFKRIQADTGASELDVYISGTGNYREEVAITKGYKANRTAPKPDHYDDIVEYMQGSWGATKVDGMETDDKVSILLWEDYVEHDADPDECTIILSSPDKDLNNTPGWHYNPRTREKRWITELQAERHFYYQLLSGDRVDNIPGLPFLAEETITCYGTKAGRRGVGPGTAKKIMQAHPDDHREAVYRAYCEWGKQSGMPAEILEDYLIEQGQLLWMLREEGQMWHPTAELTKVISEVYATNN